MIQLKHDQLRFRSTHVTHVRAEPQLKVPRVGHGSGRWAAKWLKSAIQTVHRRGNQLPAPLAYLNVRNCLELVGKKPAIGSITGFFSTVYAHCFQ